MWLATQIQEKKEAAAATSNKPNSAQNPSAARGLPGHQTSEAVSNALAGDGFTTRRCSQKLVVKLRRKRDASVVSSESIFMTLFKRCTIKSPY